MDYSLPSSSVHGIFQARILERVAMPSPSGDLPDPGVEPSSPVSPALAGRFFTSSVIWEAHTHRHKHMDYRFIYKLHTYTPTCTYAHTLILWSAWIILGMSRIMEHGSVYPIIWKTSHLLLKNFIRNLQVILDSSFPFILPYYQALCHLTYIYSVSSLYLFLSVFTVFTGPQHLKSLLLRNYGVGEDS